MPYPKILEKLPYSKPFLFVDALGKVDQDGAEGSFTFSADMDFFQGHFKGTPVTPGVLLTECCAQIGLVCLGIYLLEQDGNGPEDDLGIALSSTQMDFYLPVLPDEQVFVRSKKVYFRFGKLKCEVKMYNADKRLVCQGTMAGMLKSRPRG